MKRLFFLIMFLIPIIINNKVLSYNTSSYCVLENESLRILESNNEHKISLIASTTKILTALVAIESNDIFKNIVVKKKDTLIDGSKVYFKENEEVYLVDVLYGLILRSGNDCANILATNLYSSYEEFIEKMNDKCKKIGMINSTFSNPSGLDNGTINYSTSYDLCLLMIEAMKNEMFRTIASSQKYSFSTNFGSYTFINKHKLVVNDECFIAGKTGYTKKSGRILVSYASKYNMDVAIATINDSNDWENHKIYLNNIKKYSTNITINSGKFYYNDYILILDTNIVVPIYDSEKNKIIYSIIINVEGAHLLISINGKIVLKRRLDISYKIS